MTRAELEAAIWWILRGTGAITGGHVDAIIAAADRYALTAYGITADRRAELARAGAAPAVKRGGTGPAIHFRDDFEVPACRHSASGMLDPVLTLTRQHVTCARCKRTRAWLEAA